MILNGQFWLIQMNFTIKAFRSMLILEMSWIGLKKVQENKSFPCSLLLSFFRICIQKDLGLSGAK